VHTLATINSIVRARPRRTGASRARAHRLVPYMLVAPERPQEIGEIAARVYRQHYGGLVDAATSPSVSLLGRAFNAGRSSARGELFSYLFFAREFAEELMRRGRADAERWLRRRHDDGPWQVRPLAL